MGKYLNIEEYPNILNDLPYSTNWIKNQIKDNKLVFLPVRSYLAERYSPKINENSGKYTFVSIFYNYIYHNHKIPTQEEFYDKVHEVFLEEENYFSLKDKCGFIDGFKARVYRTYPSIIRDFYFNKLLSENGYEVIYSLKLDVQDKIDTLLIIDNKYYGVGMFVDTPRSRQKREDKLSRLDKFDNVDYVDLPIIVDEHCETVGKIWLYTQYHIEKLMKVLNQC
jgi:hypothetical protein